MIFIAKIFSDFYQKAADGFEKNKPHAKELLMSIWVREKTWAKVKGQQSAAAQSNSSALKQSRTRTLFHYDTRTHNKLYSY